MLPFLAAGRLVWLPVSHLPIARALLRDLFLVALLASPTCTLGRGLRLSAFVVAGIRQRCSWPTVWPAS